MTDFRDRYTTSCTLEVIESSLDPEHLCPECAMEVTVFVAVWTRGGMALSTVKAHACLDQEMCGWRSPITGLV